MSAIVSVLARLTALCVVSAAGATAVPAQETPLTLTGAAAAALETDPSLAASVARSRGAGADLIEAGAARWPTLSLDGTAMRFQEPMVVAPLHSFDPSSPPRFDESLLQGAARLRYTVFDGGRIGAGIRAARAGLGAAEATVSSRRMDILERVTTAYLAVLTTRAHRDAAERRELALESEEERARNAVAAGTAADVERLRAAAALQEARADAATARSRAERAERALGRIMGADPATLVGRPLADVDVDPASSSSGEPPEEHPELERARARAEAAEERVDAERATRFPRIRLEAAVLDYGTWTGNHVAEWQAGIGVSWPLFTGGARSAAVRRADAEVVAARQETEAARRSLGAAVDDARSSITEADERAGALRASITQWEEVARIEALALENGAGVQSDLLAAEAGLFRARAAWAEARYDRVLARVRLARALGRLDESWMRQTLEVER